MYCCILYEEIRILCFEGLFCVKGFVFFVVLRIEDDVARFVSDKTRCTIEFAPDLSSYQVHFSPTPHHHSYESFSF